MFDTRESNAKNNIKITNVYAKILPGDHVLYLILST